MPKSKKQPTSADPIGIVQPGLPILDDFFYNLAQLEGVDAKVAEMLKDLYKNSQLSKDAIIQKLAEIRQGKNG